MSEDKGRAAELRLHGYRQNLRRYFPVASGAAAGRSADWTQEDVSALRWIEGLASSGHWGAKRLRDEMVRMRSAMEAVARHDRELLLSLARHSVRAAEAAALVECSQPEPDWNQMSAWLTTSERPVLSKCLAEARRVLGRLEGPDVERLRFAIEQEVAGVDLLPALAAWRLASPDAAHREAGSALLESACRFGSRKALAARLGQEWKHASDKEALFLSWCDRYPEHVPAEEIREAFRIARPLSQGEFERVKSAMESPGEPGVLLHALAATRHEDRNCDPEIPSRLMKRAFQLSAYPEFEALWDHQRAHLPNKRAFFAMWMERFPRFRVAPDQCFAVALSLDRGEDGIPAHRAIAPPWYARAAERPLGAGGNITGSLCYFVALRLNPHVSFARANAPALSLDWYEKGIALGEDRCLDDWLKACANGWLGLEPDPDEALARVRRYLAVAPRKEGEPFWLTPGLASTVKCAQALLAGDGVAQDEERAIRWLRVGEALGYKPALDLLAGVGASRAARKPSQP